MKGNWLSRDASLSAVKVASGDFRIRASNVVWEAWLLEVAMLAEQELLVSVGTCYLLGDKQSHLIFVPFVPVKRSGTCPLPSSFPHTSLFLSA